MTFQPEIAYYIRTQGGLMKMKMAFLILTAAGLVGCATPEQRQRLGYAMSQGGQSYSASMQEAQARDEAAAPKTYTIEDNYGREAGTLRERSY
jgi:hypothetical protein